MHPAWSVIVFTSLSGTGYGLAGWTALTVLLAAPVAHHRLAWIMIFAIALITAGLLASTFHLRHPERAWRALSQWRSSWLSREGVAAIASYLPLGWMTLDLWHEAINIPAAAAVLVLAPVTIFCTAMIYASLRTVRAWSHPLVPAVYLALAAAAGAYLLLLLHDGSAITWLAPAAGIALLVAWSLKLYYWRELGNATGASTVASATGLDGDVSPLDPPHTEENYIQKEMVFRVARRHAEKLRRIAVVLGLALPLVCLGGLAVPILTVPMLGIGSVSLLVAIIVERWLFFAEARHTVALYYGAGTSAYSAGRG